MSDEFLDMRKMRRAPLTGRKPLAAFPYVNRARPLSDFQALLDRGAKLALVGIFLAVVIHSMAQWAPFLVPIVAAIVFGLILGPPMGQLERLGLPSTLAAALIILALVAAIYLLILFFAPPFAEWFTRIPELWQEIQRHLNRFRFHLTMVEQVEERVTEMTASDDPETQRVEVQGPGFIQAILSFAPPAVGQIILFLGALYFYLATRHSIRQGILSLCFHRGTKLRAARIIRDVETNISRYLLTIALINAGLGVATGIAMALLGMPSPALWGMMAAIFNFVLYVGPLAFIVLLSAVGLVTYDTLGAALLPPAIFVLLNLIESQFVTPLILGRRLTLNPFVIVVTLGFYMWLWGPVGAFLALPLLIITVITFAHILPREAQPTARKAIAKARAEQQAAPSARLSSAR